MLFPGEHDSDYESFIIDGSDGESDLFAGTTIRSQCNRSYAKKTVCRKLKRKGSNESPVETCVQPANKKSKRNVTTAKGDGQCSIKMRCTVEGVMISWNDTTEYGMSFRTMSDEEQLAEVLRLNKGTEKQMKGIIKNKLIAVNYTTLVADKLREHFSASRVAQPSDHVSRIAKNHQHHFMQS
jgi:hypothetical protein